MPNPTASASTAIAGNTANLPAVQNLAASSNSFNQAQALQNLEAAVPGFGKLQEKSSANIAEQLAGEVPDDVVNGILTSAAERGILTGSPGSPNANAAYLRALGLTSLGQQEAGQRNLSASVARAPQVPLFNLSSMMTTPGEVQDADLTRNIYASAPVPEAAGKYAEDLYMRRLLEAQKLGTPASFGSGTWTGTRGTNLASPNAGWYQGKPVGFSSTTGGNVVRGV